MAEERIEGLISKEALDQFSKLKELTDANVAAFEKLIEKGVEVNKTLGSAKGIREVNNATKEVAENEKQLEKQVKDLAAANAKLQSLYSDEAKKLAELKVQQQARNQQLKEEVQLNQAAEGSIKQKQVQLKQLQRQYDELSATQRSADDGKKLLSQIQGLDKELKALEASTGRFQRNVGNYQGSAKIIVDALEKAKGKFNELSRAADTSPAALQRASRELEALQRITEQPQFLNVASKVGDANNEVRFFTRQLIALEAAGQGSGEAADKLRAHLAKLTDEIADTRAEVKALSSDSRAFDLFAGAVSFAADTFQTAAGAAALFGASEKDVAEITKNLIAIQAVANGVKGIAKELTEKGTAANKAFAFVQNQVSIAFDTTATAGARLRAVLSTLFIGAIIAGIAYVVANFEKLRGIFSGLSKEQKLLNEVQEKAVDGYINEKVAIEQLLKEAKDENTTKERRNQILRDFHEKSGSYFSDLKTEKDLIEKGTGAVANYVKALELKAQAQAATELLAEKEKAIVLRQIQLEESLQKIKSVNFDSEERRKRSIAILQKTITEGTDQELQALQKQAEPARNVLDQINAKLKALGGDPGATTQSAFAKVFKFDDQDLSRLIENFKKMSEAEDAFLIARVKAREQAFELEKELLKKQRDTELANINEQIALEKTAKTVDFGKIQQLNDQKLQLEKDFANQRRRLEEDLGKDLVTIRQSFIAKERQLEKEADDQFREDQKVREQISIDSVQREHDKRLKELSEGQESEIKSLNKDFEKRILATREGTRKREKVEEEFAARRSEIEFRYAKATLETEIELAKRLIALRKSLGQDTSAAEKELANAEMALSDLVTKHKLENNKRQAKSEKDKLKDIEKGIETVQTIQQKVGGILSGFLSANTDRQKNDLQDQIDGIEEKKNKEIEAINASALSEQEKADRIKVIEATAASRKQQLEQKQRQLDIQRAKFEKAKNIGEIIVNTALAVVKALPNIPLAIAVGALGAAELAVAIATPIPHFEHGTDDAPGGLSLVGEKRRELVITPSGELIETPGRPTLMNIPKHSVIYPNSREVLESGILSGLNAAPSLIDHRGYYKEMTKSMDKGFDKLDKTIRRKKELNLSTSERGLSAMWRYGANRIGYVEEQVKF